MSAGRRVSGRGLFTTDLDTLVSLVVVLLLGLLLPE